MSNFIILTPYGGMGILQIEPRIDIDAETNDYGSTININIRGLAIHNLSEMTWSIGEPVHKQLGMTIHGISVPINLPPGSRIRRASEDDLKSLIK